MKLSIVSTQRQTFSPPSACFSQTRSFVLWKPHTYAEEPKQFRGSTHCENTSCSSHTACLPGPLARPEVTQSLSLSLSFSLMKSSCISSLTHRNFPVSVYEKKKAAQFLLTCSPRVTPFHCKSGFQQSFSWQSPGYSLFCFQFIPELRETWLVFWKHVRQSPEAQHKRLDSSRSPCPYPCLLTLHSSTTCTAKWGHKENRTFKSFFFIIIFFLSSHNVPEK